MGEVVLHPWPGFFFKQSLSEWDRITFPAERRCSVPEVCWFRRSCCQAPLAGAGFSFLPAAAAVGAAETAPWAPLDRLAAGAAADPSERTG